MLPGVVKSSGRSKGAVRRIIPACAALWRGSYGVGSRAVFSGRTSLVFAVGVGEPPGYDAVCTRAVVRSGWIFEEYASTYLDTAF